MCPDADVLPARTGCTIRQAKGRPRSIEDRDGEEEEEEEEEEDGRPGVEGVSRERRTLRVHTRIAAFAPLPVGDCCDEGSRSRGESKDTGGSVAYAQREATRTSKMLSSWREGSCIV